MNAVFRALDDSTRRKILELLHDGDLSAGEIAEKFAMTKPSISHHLDLLKQANLVVAVRRGQYQVYSLNLSVVDETVQWMLSIGARKPRKKKLPSLQKTRQFRTV